jgi:hypothetical protein
MNTLPRPLSASWQNGYPTDYVTANAICLNDEFDPDEDRSVRVGFRRGYFPDVTYQPDFFDFVADFLDDHWQRLRIHLGLA